MRSNYWSCTQFASWIRGTPKLKAGTPAEWREWRQTARAAHPLRFWIAETLLSRIQDVVWAVPDAWASVRARLLNRWVTETHLLRASSDSIPAGSWRDFGDRVLPCVFDGFARWVEREVGLAYFEWAKDLKFDDEWIDPSDERHGTLTPQAQDAREVLVLHWWWRYERPQRQATDEQSLKFYADMSQKYSGCWLDFDDQLTPAEREQRRLIWHTEHERELAYELEDTAMLKRLIDIRTRLWH